MRTMRFNHIVREIRMPLGLAACGTGLLMLLGLTAGAQQSDPRTAPAAADAGQPPPLRDPFWPVGYRPYAEADPGVGAGPQRLLTDEELLEYAKLEQERIKKMLDVRGTITRGNKRYFWINDKYLVTEGDIITMDVGGVGYKLVIKSLTSNNILLEPYREAGRRRSNTP